MTIHNPLKRSILKILEQTTGPLKEHELHKILGGDSFTQFVDGCSEELTLFRKHFLVMNALYELHEELIPQGIFLHISALHIELKKMTLSGTQELSSDSTFDHLSRYYRDWQNFNKTDDSDVKQLLQQFWKNYLSHEEKNQALECLQLDTTVSWSEIQQQYRRLCQQHHPDKGGDALHFVQIRQAYENLKCIYERFSAH